MINSIDATKKYNQFSQFGYTSNEDSRMYWLNNSTPTMPDEHEKKDTDKIELKNFKIITPDEARKTRNTRILGISIAGATIATAGGIFTLMRGGGSRKLIQILNNLKNYFEKKIGDAKIENRALDTMERCFLVVISAIEKLIKKSEVVNNFTTFKDLLFKKIMNTTKPTGKIHDAITERFERLGRQSVINSYANTENQIIATQIISQKNIRKILNETTDTLVEINGKKLPKSEWVKQIKTLDSEIQTLFDEHFSHKALKKRYYTIKQIADNLRVGLTKLKSFFSPDVYKNFIADSRIIKEKEAIRTTVKNKRYDLSYTPIEMIKNSDEALDKIAKLISFKDTNNRKILKEIKTNLKKYLKQPENQKEIQETILKNIQMLRSNISNHNIEKLLNNSDIGQLSREIDELEKFISTYKPGKIQELLSIYKHILPKKEYRNLEKTYMASIKSLDSSIRMETEDFVNKLRDLTMGSAPTDMLTLVGGVTALGYNLAKSDNNEQRISISLKYGIPALAGIGVSLFCNAKLFAGSKALIVGSISTWLLNRIGSSSDRWLKAHRAQKQQNRISQT